MPIGFVYPSATAFSGYYSARSAMIGLIRIARRIEILDAPQAL
jgi:hypothetical protein